MVANVGGRPKHKYISKLAIDIADFHNFRVKRGFSEVTYKGSLRSLDAYYAKKYPDLEVLTREAVLAWISDQNSAVDVLAINSIAIRQFAEYLHAMGKEAYILPAAFLPRSKRMTPYIFSDAEIKALFYAIDTMPISANNAFEHHVAPILFRLMYTCGLRPNEAYDLTTESVNVETGEIFLKHTKGHKERIVVMSDDMLVLYKDYLKKLAIYMPRATYAFPFKKDIPFNGDQATYILRKCWAHANSHVPAQELPCIRPYDLRHRFASAVLSKWVSEGCDINAKLPYLRTYMGHDDIALTAYYIHLIPDNIVKAGGVNWNKLNDILPEVVL
ncbi:MAG: tyrosine-type recombinase/integrase [Firmicutes bacterium]|nr:tyrosine-type recombinase/integrase [Bacillota bacterium]